MAAAAEGLSPRRASVGQAGRLPSCRASAPVRPSTATASSVEKGPLMSNPDPANGRQVETVLHSGRIPEHVGRVQAAKLCATLHCTAGGEPQPAHLASRRRRRRPGSAACCRRPAIPTACWRASTAWLPLHVAAPAAALRAAGRGAPPLRLLPLAPLAAPRCLAAAGRCWPPPPASQHS